MTETRERLPLSERREVLRDFRKQCGVTLTELGKLAHVSQPMLSQFENGARDLSAEAWDRVLDAMEKFLSRAKTEIIEKNERLKQQLAKAGETAEKLGVIAQPEANPFSSTLGEGILDLIFPNRPGAFERYKANYEDVQRRFGTEGEALFRQLIEAQGELKKHRETIAHQRETIARLQDELAKSHIEAASLKDWLDQEMVAALKEEESLEEREKALNLRLRVHREEARQMQAPEQPAEKALSVRLFEAVLSGRPLTQEEHEQADAARETVRNLKRKIRGNK